MKMNPRKFCAYLLILSGLFTITAISQEQAAEAVFKPEELEQILAPIALYPDSLLSQIFMAATYPLEVVQAQRWVEQNKSLTGQALVDALEKQTWDPSVKSLVNFPQVLTMMNEKLDWTQKLGDAFLAQQKDVMDTVQMLRKKAQELGNLKSTDKQTVTTQQDTIIVEYANPQVVYVPTYDPVVVYGTWPYPAYPPYYYYPPAYYPGAPWIYFSAGAAWGYAWGHCDWDDCDIDIDVDHNYDLGGNIDRDKYVEHYKESGRFEEGKGKWKHNPENRKGVAYRDQATAKQFNRASTADAVKSREAFRGRADQALGNVKPADLSQRGDLSSANRPSTGAVGSGGPANRPSTLPAGSGAARPPSTTTLPSTTRPPITTRTPSTNSLSSNRGGAMDGMNSGSAARNYSSRGAASRQSMSRPSGSSGMGGGARPSGGARPGGGRGGGGRR